MRIRWRLEIAAVELGRVQALLVVALSRVGLVGQLKAGRVGLERCLREDRFDARFLGAVLKLESHRATLEAKAVERDVGVAGLVLGGEFDEAEVEPLLAALDDAAERAEHLDEVDFLERGVQIADEQRVVEVACGGVGLGGAGVRDVAQAAQTGELWAEVGARAEVERRQVDVVS